MNKFASAALVAVSMVVATPCLAQTTAFSFTTGEAWNRGDVWRMAQSNLRIINRSFDLEVPDVTSRMRVDPFYGFDYDAQEEVEPTIVCIAGVICYETYGRPVHW